jgi:hypothetical protein
MDRQTVIGNQWHDEKARHGNLLLFCFFVVSAAEGREYEIASSFSNPSLDFIFRIGYY